MWVPYKLVYNNRLLTWSDRTSASTSPAIVPSCLADIVRDMQKSLHPSALDVDQFVSVPVRRSNILQDAMRWVSRRSFDPTQRIQVTVLHVDEVGSIYMTLSHALCADWFPRRRRSWWWRTSTWVLETCCFECRGNHVLWYKKSQVPNSQLSGIAGRVPYKYRISSIWTRCYDICSNTTAP